MKRAQGFIHSLLTAAPVCAGIALLSMLLVAFLPVTARASTVVLAFVAVPAAGGVLVLPVQLAGSVELPALDSPVVSTDSSGDLPIIWLPMPPYCAVAAVPSLFAMDYQELKRNPHLAQATASRIISTAEAVADNYEFPWVADMLHDFNGQQQVMYRRLKDLHQRYIVDHHLDIRRIREDGGTVYVLGYRNSF